MSRCLQYNNSFTPQEINRVIASVTLFARNAEKSKFFVRKAVIFYKEAFMCYILNISNFDKF